jgi:hypothetical protein
MASIVGEGYKYAEGSGWAVPDKIFGYLDQLGNVYNKIRYPQPGQAGYVEAEAKLRTENAGMFGLPAPWGALILIGGAGLIVFVIYRVAK